jgi:hypothetical protein
MSMANLGQHYKASFGDDVCSHKHPSADEAAQCSELGDDVCVVVFLGPDGLPPLPARAPTSDPEPEPEPEP